MRFILLSFLCLFTTACSHQYQQKAVQNSDIIILPNGNYNFQQPTASDYEEPVAAGRISRYERKIIVPGGPGGEMSPCAKNFDGIMDNLEGLMSEQIRKNNDIAAKQAAAYSY